MGKGAQFSFCMCHLHEAKRNKGYCVGNKNKGAGNSVPLEVYLQVRTKGLGTVIGQTHQASVWEFERATGGFSPLPSDSVVVEEGSPSPSKIFSLYRHKREKGGGALYHCRPWLASGSKGGTIGRLKIKNARSVLVDRLPVFVTQNRCCRQRIGLICMGSFKFGTSHETTFQACIRC